MGSNPLPGAQKMALTKAWEANLKIFEIIFPLGGGGDQPWGGFLVGPGAGSNRSAERDDVRTGPALPHLT